MGMNSAFAIYPLLKKKNQSRAGKGKEVKKSEEKSRLMEIWIVPIKVQERSF